MRHLGLLATRTIFGSYLAVHGAQKLFGTFGGGGLEATGAAFESLGMKPGKAMAALAGASEFGGGILTATGIAEPLGPLTIAGTMVVASATHRKQGPLMQNGGFELPLTNFAVAVALLSSGMGRYRLGPRLPSSLVRLAVVGGTVLATVSLAQLLSARPPSQISEASTESDDEDTTTGDQ
jgi:putative oxidoreductase